MSRVPRDGACFQWASLGSLTARPSRGSRSTAGRPQCAARSAGWHPCSHSRAACTAPWEDWPGPWAQPVLDAQSRQQAAPAESGSRPRGCVEGATLCLAPRRAAQRPWPICSPELAAPTGSAARRKEQSSGPSPCTVLFWKCRNAPEGRQCGPVSPRAASAGGGLVLAVPSPPICPPHSILLEYSKGNPRNPKCLPVNTFQCTSLKYERPGTGATPRAHAAGPRGGAALPWGGLGRPRPDLGVCPAPPHLAGRGCRGVDRVPGEPRRSPGAGGATPRLPLRRVPAASRPCRRCG